MQLVKENFTKTTHIRQYQQLPSMQQLVEGWVITLTTQTKVTNIAVSTCNKRGEVLINMLLAGDTANQPGSRTTEWSRLRASGTAASGPGQYSKQSL